MVNAGFGEPVVDDFRVPNSPWPEDKKLKEVGCHYQATMEQDVEGMSGVVNEGDSPLTSFGRVCVVHVHQHHGMVGRPRRSGCTLRPS